MKSITISLFYFHHQFKHWLESVEMPQQKCSVCEKVRHIGLQDNVHRGTEILYFPKDVWIHGTSQWIMNFYHNIQPNIIRFTNWCLINTSFPCTYHFEVCIQYLVTACTNKTVVPYSIPFMEDVFHWVHTELLWQMVADQWVSPRWQLAAAIIQAPIECTYNI